MADAPRPELGHDTGCDFRPDHVGPCSVVWDMHPVAAGAVADQLAATLRDQTPTHDGERCDAFAPCASCAAARQVHTEARQAARRSG